MVEYGKLISETVSDQLFPTPEKDSPSVTTILSALAKPALIQWAAKEERKMIGALAAKLYEQLYHIVDEPVTPEKFYEILMEEAGKGAHRQLLEKASAVGTQVHKRIEWELKGELGYERSEEPPPLTFKQAQNSFDRWTEWRVSVNLRPIAIEKQLYTVMFGWGGTLDLLADTDEGLAIIDFKTGKAVYAESFLQNEAYRVALREEGIDAKIGWIVRLPKYEDDPEFDAVRVPNDPRLVSVFIALRTVYLWWNAQKVERKRLTADEKPATVGATGE